MRSVSSLDSLVSRREVGTDADVDVLFGGSDLRFVHDRETTPKVDLCQEKNGAPDGIRTHVKTAL